MNYFSGNITKLNNSTKISFSEINKTQNHNLLYLFAFVKEKRRGKAERMENERGEEREKNKKDRKKINRGGRKIPR